MPHRAGVGDESCFRLKEKQLQNLEAPIKHEVKELRGNTPYVIGHMVTHIRENGAHWRQHVGTPSK